MSAVKPNSQAARSSVRAVLPMPSSMRELLQLLTLRDPAQPLSTLFERVDTAGVTPARVALLVHGHVPDDPARVLPPAQYDARVHLHDAVQSAEFQAGIVRTLLTSFPEKRRDVFIHIPKCAGTDFTFNLAPRRLTVPHNLQSPDWISRDEMLDTAIDIVRNAPFYDAFFVYGHIEFSRFVETIGR